MLDLFTTENVVALLALTVMEIVLGIDNIVFISVLTGKLPQEEQRRSARWIGLSVAMGARIILLLTVSWIMRLVHPVFFLEDLRIGAGWLAMKEHHEVNEITWRDLILLVGGLFLIRSSVMEIHHKMEGMSDKHGEAAPRRVTMASVLAQIVLIDVIFSLDSVITAVGMAKDVRIMIAAIIVSVGVMMIFSGHVSRFVEKHPTVKMLALSFLLLIGVMLVAEGIGTHIDKGYIYFAMAFSLGVEVLNLRASAKGKASIKHPAESTAAP